MSQISTKINLAALKSTAIMKLGKNNVECIVIPISQNQLYKSDKGAVYLDLVGFESKPREGSKDTHLVKQSFSKDILAKMTEDEKRAMPILGNHIDWSKIQNTSSNQEDGAPLITEEDDLPF
jgi:hypothetical protein